MTNMVKTKAEVEVAEEDAETKSGNSEGLMGLEETEEEERTASRRMRSLNTQSGAERVLARTRSRAMAEGVAFRRTREVDNDLFATYNPFNT